MVITASADELKAGFERYLYPGGKDKSAGEKNYLSKSQRKLLLRWTLEAYYDRGYNGVLHQTGIDEAIDELVERRVVAQPWAAQYCGTSLYKGQVGSEEKAQALAEEARAQSRATLRAKAIETRENDLDGGAAAPGLDHKASYQRRRTRESDTVARGKKVEPPKYCEQTAFLRKHRPEAKGCCDDCERPLAPSIYSPGQRRPVDYEHQKGGHHAGRLRACLTVDVGCNEAQRAEIDEYNAALHRVGMDPMSAEDWATLCKMRMFRLGRLPDDDSDFEEIERHVEETDRAVAIARWPALDDPQTVASTTRSDRDFGDGREEAIAERRERLAAQPSHVAAARPKARAAYAAQQRKEAAVKKAKREANKARCKARREAKKGKPAAPPAYRQNVLPPAPAPRGPRRPRPVKLYNPADEAAKRQSCPQSETYFPRPTKPAKRRRRR